MHRMKLLVLLWAVVRIAATTNLDTLEPAVIQSPARSTDTNDGFGWAAIFHQIEPILEEDGMEQTLLKTRVIIGAPRGSYPGGFNLSDPGLPATVNTGLVYSCPLGPGDCEPIRGDTTRYVGGGINITNGYQVVMNSDLTAIYSQGISEGRLFDQAPNSHSRGGDFNQEFQIERKQGQLMGSVLYSNGDTLVACAPRWVQNVFAVNAGQPRGICFSGDRNLTNFRTLFPCTGTGFASSATLVGYCSAGTSVTILNGRVYIGAPGFEVLSGAVYSRLLSAPNSDEWDATYNPQNVPVAGHGTRIASGYVTSNDRQQEPSDFFILSHRGIENQYLGGLHMYRSDAIASDEVVQEFEGMQIAEFFGYAIALCDLTGDGYDELVVGAPMYTVLPHTETIQTEIGRLYVYFNNGGSLESDPVIILGQQAGSRFGFSLTCLGDIDADGHEDVAVGAPYERSSSTQNTGAVYIYYGRDTREEFKNQIPQKIHGDDIVNSVVNLTQLRTFGFSLSGKADVDRNQYNDVVVGGYIDQAVIVLRTLPVINVTITIGHIANIAVDTPEPRVEVNVNISYEGVGVPGPIDIPFTLSEVTIDQTPRLFFTNGNTEDTQFDGFFTVQGPSTVSMQTITVYAKSDFAETRPYQLQLELNDVERPVSSVPVDGQQTLSDLSAYPRIRASGDTMATINLTNPCGDDGCTSDISLSVDTSDVSLMLIQGKDRRISFPLTYINMGTEEARDITLTITDFEDVLFQQISLSPAGQAGVVFDCLRPALNETIIGIVTCDLDDRFEANQRRSVILSLIVNSGGFIGSEANFSISVTIGVSSSTNNSDVNLANNQVLIPFSFGADSDISVEVSFANDLYSYTGEVPGRILLPSDLGELVNLFVRLHNAGPSTVQNTRVNISFPSRVPSSSFLYPSRVIAQTSISGVEVECAVDGVMDPEDIDSQDEFVFQDASRRRRRKRHSSSGTLTTRSRQRQASSSDPNVVSCVSHTCVSVLCDIRKLTTGSVTFDLEFYIDERFYGSADNFGGNYTLSVKAEIVVEDDFQMGDDSSDNLDSASVLLYPASSEADITVLLHVIIWSSIGGLLLMVIFVVLLYFVGFFKRKRHPEEELEEEPQPEKPQPEEPQPEQKPEESEAPETTL